MRGASPVAARGIVRAVNLLSKAIVRAHARIVITYAAGDLASWPRDER
jgi:delta-aminolevulinic acid dehydratase/porphobilinogen synthase